jgi:hypothetical protein
MKKSWHLDRRTFLRGTGVAMALPLLEAMAHGAERAATKQPCRMACVFFPNGVSLPPDPDKREWYWFPEGSGRDYELSKSLSPLAALRDQITVLGGMEHVNSRGLHGHHACDIWLTGADIRNAYNNSISVDQVVAQAIGDQTRFPCLIMSPDGGIGQRATTFTLSFDGRGLPVPAANDPRRIFARMFGDNSAASISAQRGELHLQRSILDTVLDNARSLQRNLGKADLNKLDQYMESVRNVEQRVVKAEQWLDRPKPKVSADLTPPDVTIEEPKEFVRTYYDLMVLAFQTDSTRVATYQICPERGLSKKASNFGKSLGLPGGSHYLSHSAQQENGWKNWATLDHFLTEQFAYLLQRLGSIDEGDGSLLDCTMVLYGSSSSTTHTALNYPTILAGGTKLGLKHGQFLKHDKETPFSNVLYTMLCRMDLPKPPESFADSTGELSELVA